MDKTETKKGHDRVHNFIMATLEVDPIEWTTEENTPTYYQHSENAPKSSIRYDNKKICAKSVKKPTTTRTNSLVSDISGSLQNRLDISGMEDDLDVDHDFHRLADEVVLKIFSFLPSSSLTKAVQVCRRWKKLGYDKALWRCLNLSRRHLDQSCLNQILHRCVKVLSLNQTIVSNSDEIIDFASDDFPLAYVDATAVQCSDSVLFSILSNSKSLQYLSLEGLKLTSSQSVAISNNEKLTVLNLCLVTGLTLNNLDIITKKCTLINSLNVAWTGLTKDSGKYVCRCRYLQEINLSGLVGGMTKKVMEKLLTSCTSLVNIDLSDVKLEIGILKSISQYCSNLERLSISRCSDVGSDRLLEMINKMAKLTHLNVFGFLNADMLELVARKRPDVKVSQEYFSSIARPTTTSSFEGKIWDIYIGEGACSG